MKLFHALLFATSALALSGCDRSQPPVETIERAAEEAIGEVQGETPPQQAQGPYAPRDECLDEPGAGEFLANLRKAVEARDSDALIALSAEDVFLDFGGGTGTELLRERLAAEDGYLWDALSQILTLGCASDGARITMPWYFAQDIPIDPYMGAIVMAQDVPLRASPVDDAEVVAQLSWDAVEALEGLRDDERFLKVSWMDPGTEELVEGYIEADTLRSIIDYRIGASRRNNRWRITNFVAGD